MKKLLFIILFMCMTNVTHAIECTVKSTCLMWPSAKRIMEIDRALRNDKDRATAMMDEDRKSGAALVVPKGTFLPKILLVTDTPFIVVWFNGKEYAAFTDILSCSIDVDDDDTARRSLVIRPRE